MSEAPCPFCDLGSRVVAENDLAVAVRDQDPASRGHTLAIPKRHVSSFFDLTPEEVSACHELLVAERARIAEEFHPDGYNLGANVGPAAGQTMKHAHLHLIPRYDGDHPAPRGGIRHVIPTRR